MSVYFSLRTLKPAALTVSVIRRPAWIWSMMAARTIQHHLIGVFRPIFPWLLLLIAPGLLAGILLPGLRLLPPLLDTTFLTLAIAGIWLILINSRHLI